MRPRCRLAGWLLALLVAGGCSDSAPTSPPTADPARQSPPKSRISREEAAAVIASDRDEAVSTLRPLAPNDLEPRWDVLLAAHDSAIRRRLEGGDEDSVINFWQYGTSFTPLPRVTTQSLGRSAGASVVEDLLIRRLDDLVSGAAKPAGNERLQFVRDVLARRGIDPTTSDGAERARLFLVELREREIVSSRRSDSAARAAHQSGGVLQQDLYATLYRDRGLSSDTSLSASFAVDRALVDLKNAGRLTAPVRRVAIVGPGLDFTDKAEGFDFYPLQSIQPFAVIDSLAALGVKAADGFRLTTLDISPRVNQHLSAASARAARGEPYTLQLPLEATDGTSGWTPPFVEFWQRFGNQIGEPVRATEPPGSVGRVRVRAVAVRPEIVRLIEPIDLNVVTERLDRQAEAEAFDLVVATNVLLYYNRFEQGLALANLGRMIKPGGFLLTNYRLQPGPPFESAPAAETEVRRDSAGNGDTMVAYRRR